jgi:Tfp pilus assembly protein PilO
MDRYLKLLDRHRWRVFMACANCFFIFTLFDRIIPLCDEVFQLYQAVEDNQQKIANVDELQANAHRAKEKYEKIKLQIDELVFNQGQGNRLSTMLAFIDHAAREHGVGLQSVKPQTVKAYERHVELPVQLELSARFHALGRFLNALEAATASVIKIENLKMQSKTMTSNTLDARITLVVYYLRAAE